MVEASCGQLVARKPLYRARLVARPFERLGTLQVTEIDGGERVWEKNKGASEARNDLTISPLCVLLVTGMSMHHRKQCWQG